MKELKTGFLVLILAATVFVACTEKSEVKPQTQQIQEYKEFAMSKGREFKLPVSKQGREENLQTPSELKGLYASGKETQTMNSTTSIWTGTHLRSSSLNAGGFAYVPLSLDGTKEYALYLSTQGNSDIYLCYVRNNTLIPIKSSTRSGNSSDVVYFTTDDKPKDYAGRLYAVIVARENSQYNLYLYETIYKYRYLLNLSNYQHYYQKRLPTAFRNDDSFDSSCDEFPNYTGGDTYEIESPTRRCGFATFLIAASLVQTDDDIPVPNTIKEKADRLAEFYKFYKDFFGLGSWNVFAEFTKLASSARGNVYHKGFFTHWNDCEDKSNYNSVKQVAYAKNTSGRTSFKTALENSLKNGHPFILAVKINGSASSPNDSNYFTRRTATHIICVTGILRTSDGAGSIVYYSDPLFDDDEIHSVDYTALLNAAKYDDNTYYNGLEVKGM